MNVTSGNVVVADIERKSAAKEAEIDVVPLRRSNRNRTTNVRLQGDICEAHFELFGCSFFFSFSVFLFHFFSLIKYKTWMFSYIVINGC